MSSPDVRTLSHHDEQTATTARVQPFLFVVLHADDLRRPSSRHALGDIDEVHFRRGATRETFRVQQQGKRQLVLTFADPWMSSMHARLQRRGDEWFLEDTGSKNGTFVDGQRTNTAHLSRDRVLELGHTFLLFRHRAPAAPDASLDFTASADSRRLSTLSPELARTFAGLEDLADSAIPVLVRGETGTGKEVVAQELHRLSTRRGALVAVNCGALPSTLVEAELFGFKRGSFSGAVDDRAGLVRAAHKGTLFLDEIGDLPSEAQPALLRVLQECTVVSLGSTAPTSVDFRLVSATHQNLEEMVEKRQFREDLFARLSGFSVRLPPLRARREDLGILLNHLLPARADGSAPALSLECARALFAHPWPQNVRELQRRLGVACALAKGGIIELQHVFEQPATGEAMVAEDGERSRQLARRGGVQLSAEDVVRRDQMILLLREHQGNVTAVARAMGKARVQVQRWIRRYGLERGEVPQN